MSSPASTTWVVGARSCPTTTDRQGEPFTPKTLALRREPLNILHRIQSLPDDEFGAKVKASLKTLQGAIKIFGPKSLIASFNGGKDATVILHLFRAAMAGYHQDPQGGDAVSLRAVSSQASSSAHASSEAGVGVELAGQGFPTNESGTLKSKRKRPLKTKGLFFIVKDEFDEVIDFVDDIADENDVEMIKYNVGWMEGISHLVETESPLIDGRRHTLGIILGTRDADPDIDDRGIYAPSSYSLPPFMRIQPIMNWTYGDVWKFLTEFDLAYCCLYDKGYTSLGPKQKTLRNPELRKEDGSYLPAKDLKNWDSEREGRVISSKPK